MQYIIDVFFQLIEEIVIKCLKLFSVYAIVIVLTVSICYVLYKLIKKAQLKLGMIILFSIIWTPFVYCMVGKYQAIVALFFCIISFIVSAVYEYYD